MLALKTSEFIERAKSIHNNRYDYSKVEYTGANAKICIICPKHGEFWQMPSNHLQGHGCPKCARVTASAKKKKSLENFIKEANERHNNKYDYSLVNYVNNQTKVCIICPIHGEFWQAPGAHLSGKGCSKCGRIRTANLKRSTTDKFIKRARLKHGDKYDYSKVNYINERTKVCIICPIHGEFWQEPDSHLNGRGCYKCSIIRASKLKSLTTDEFIKKAKKIHGDKYDYSKVKYINNQTKVCIICPEHGEFWQKANNHLNGQECSKCGRIRTANLKRSTTDKFIKRARLKHGDKYDYSQVKYINAHTLVSIICPKHGEFWQMPNKHLLGHGCPKCRSSHLEQETEKLLKKYNIKYETQKRFNWLITEKMGRMSLDFYLPIYNAAIECQGEQHYFSNTRGFFTKELINRIKRRDCLKKQLCEEHDIQILYIKYNDDINERMKKIVNELNK